MGQLEDPAQAAAECRERWGLTPDGSFVCRYWLAVADRLEPLMRR